MAAQTIQQILTVPEAIESRHSIRKFAQKPIPKEDINSIFELVRLTPSAWNVQPWRFHVVTDPNIKEKLKEAAYGQQQVTSAPAVVLVVSDMEDVIENLAETVHPGMPPERRQEEVANLSSFFGSMTSWKKEDNGD